MPPYIDSRVDYFSWCHYAICDCQPMIDIFFIIAYWWGRHIVWMHYWLFAITYASHAIAAISHCHFTVAETLNAPPPPGAELSAIHTLRQLASAFDELAEFINITPVRHYHCCHASSPRRLLASQPRRIREAEAAISGRWSQTAEIRWVSMNISRQIRSHFWLMSHWRIFSVFLRNIDIDNIFFQLISWIISFTIAEPLLNSQYLTQTLRFLQPSMPYFCRRHTPITASHGWYSSAS